MTYEQFRTEHLEELSDHFLKSGFIPMYVEQLVIEVGESMDAAYDFMEGERLRGEAD